MPVPDQKLRAEDEELLRLVSAVIESTNSRQRRRAGESKRKLLRWFKRHGILLSCGALCLALFLLCAVAVTRPVTSPTPPQPASEPPLGAIARPSPATGPRRAGTRRTESSYRPATGTRYSGQTMSPLSHWFGLLEDPDWRVRSQGAYQLVRRSRESTLVASSLEVVLDDPHAGVRFWVVSELRVRGWHEERVKAAIRDFAGNDEIQELYGSLSIEERRAFERVIRKWLRAREEPVRWTALTICGMIEEGSRSFRPSLERIANRDPNKRFRKQARLVLKAL